MYRIERMKKAKAVMPNFVEVLLLLLFSSASVLLLPLVLGSSVGPTSVMATAVSSHNDNHNDNGQGTETEEIRDDDDHHQQEKQHQHSTFPYASVCLSNSNCSTTSNGEKCCAVGLDRYTFPTCKPLGQIGDSCIPDNSPQNFTLNYPDGTELQVIQSFTMLCPCAPGLQCDRVTVSCSIAHSLDTDTDTNKHTKGSME